MKCSLRCFDRASCGDPCVDQQEAREDDRADEMNDRGEW